MMRYAPYFYADGIAEKCASMLPGFMPRYLTVGRKSIMPRGTNQKFKLYRLAQIMLERTDEEHYITMPEIIAALEEYEITADRKSIYNDLRDLEVLGIEVEGEPSGNRYHYHVVSRPFELPELKLLVDAIQSSKFITERKTNARLRSWKRWSACMRRESCSGRSMCPGGLRP